MKKIQALLNATDILRFLTAKGWVGVCSECGSRDLTPLDESHIRARIVWPAIKHDHEKELSDGVLEVILIACSNCGSVRPHERRVVANWVAAHPLS